jgi:hypothetical protein
METVLSKHSPPSAFKGVSKEEEESLLGHLYRSDLASKS